MKYCMGLVMLVLFNLIAAPVFCQDTTAQQTFDKDLYQSKRKAAKGMIIGGAVSMGVGLITLGVSATVATAEIVPAIFGQEPQYEEETTAGAIIGTVLFFGGTGVLIAGLVTNGKANKMMNGQMSISNQVPPVRIGSTQLLQTGVTLQWQLRSGKAKR